MATYPGLDGLTAKYDAAEAEFVWWAERWPDFVRRYPDEFIAVRGEDVIAHGARITDVLDAIELLGIGVDETRLRFIDADPSRLIL